VKRPNLVIIVTASALVLTAGLAACGGGGEERIDRGVVVGRGPAQRGQAGKQVAVEDDPGDRRGVDGPGREGVD